MSTLDSMVGYRSDKYQYFGKASARLDDLLNFIPARLTILVISIAAIFCKADSVQAWHIGWRDRLKHKSPNAGHAESSVAGALAIKLGGDTVYAHGVVKKPWLGNGTSDVEVTHLIHACRLICCATFIATLFSTAILLLFYYFE